MGKVRDLLSDPARWTKKTRARNAYGVPISPTNPDACQFCLMGALDKCYTDGWLDAYVKLTKTCRELGFGIYGVALFNDVETTTHEVLMAVLEKADV